MTNSIKKTILLLAAVTMTSLTMFSQEMHSLMFRRAVKSPEVTEAGVTFRFNAPKARKVQVAASWLDYNPANAEMAQERDGVWSITLPLPTPELYTYNFVVDGVTMLDPANVFVQRDGARYLNAFIVEGDYADYYKESDKPGNLEQVWYQSAENDMTRRLYVYTPYGYDHHKTKVKYPVLYLLHGGGGDEDAWSTLGRTCQILDNLIGSVAVHLVPVVGRDYGHIADGEILVQGVEGGRRAAAAAAHHSRAGLVGHERTAREEESVEEGRELAGDGGIVHGRTEDDAVALGGKGHHFVHHVIAETAAAVLAAGSAGDTARNRIGADMEYLRGNALVDELGSHFGKRSVGTAAHMGAAVDEQDFHLSLLF